MNKLILSAVIIIGLSVPAKASECKFKYNIDCYPSLGFNMSMNALSGDSQITKAIGVTELKVGDSLINNSYNLDAWEKTSNATIDFRVPISNYTTVMGSLGYTNHSGDLGNSFDVRGGEFGIGFRHYLR